MKKDNNSNQSEIIPRLYLKMLPVQIILVIIGGVNGIIDNAFAGNLIGQQAMAVTGLFSPATNLLMGINALVFGGAQVLCGKYLGKMISNGCVRVTHNEAVWIYKNVPKKTRVIVF